MKKKMGRTAEKEVVRENLLLDFLNCSCHKKRVRSPGSHLECWNIGTLEYWVIGIWLGEFFNRAAP